MPSRGRREGWRERGREGEGVWERGRECGREEEERVDKVLAVVLEQITTSFPNPSTRSLSNASSMGSRFSGDVLKVRIEIIH